jgi:hypothetical protein
MKDAAIRIRLEKELRDAFSAACNAQSLEASRVLREFMQTYVERQQAGQGDLFAGTVRGAARKKRKAA